MMDCRPIAIDISLIYAHAINLIEFFPSSSSFQEPANLAVCRARKKPQQHLTTGKTRRSIKSTNNNNGVIKRGALKFYMNHEWIWEELSINRSDRQLSSWLWHLWPSNAKVRGFTLLQFLHNWSTARKSTGTGFSVFTVHYPKRVGQERSIAPEIGRDLNLTSINIDLHFRVRLVHQ